MTLEDTVAVPEKVTVNGIEYGVNFNISSIIQLEKVFGDIDSFLQKVSTGDLKLSDQVKLLSIGISTVHPDFDENLLLNIGDITQFVEAFNAVTNPLKRCFGAPDAVEDIHIEEDKKGKKKKTEKP